jgi:hypothetical protein
MKPCTLRWLGLTLAGLVLTGQPAAAAWDNVFQVTCFHCRHNSTSQYYAAPVVVQSSPVVVQSSPVVAASAPCGDPCQQTQCTTRYIQRCYYEPVTTYQTQSYYEPVTTYRTSYYYEPVCSYTYKCFFDPCSCSYKQVAVPTKSYVLRSQCCPVQSWVQRCTQVPVTSYRQAFYWQPQTTCCTTTNGAPIAAVPSGVAVQSPGVAVQSPGVAVQTPGVSAVQTPGVSPPNVSENLQPNMPRVTEQTTPGTGTLPQQYDRYYGPPAGGTNWKPGTGTDSYQPSLGTPTPSGLQSPEPPVRQQSQPKVTLDRIVSSSGNVVQGQLVQANYSPRANASLVFIKADQNNMRQVVTSGASGRFEVSLSSGSWRVYVTQPGGQQVYHSDIAVTDRQTPFITLVSRQ